MIKERKWNRIKTVGTLLIPAILFSYLLVNVSLVKAESFDWLTFHYDESRTGATKEIIRTDSLLEQWRYQTGSSISCSPVAQNDAIYIAADNRRIYCLDGQTGEKRWETQPFLNYPLPFGSPTIQNDKMYFVTGGASEQPSYLYCYSTNGDKLWSFAAFGQISSSSALVFGNKIFFGASTDLIYCINESGSQVWQYGLNSPIQSSPCAGAGRVFAVTGKGRVYAFDYNNFTTLFEVDLPLASNSDVKSSPVYMDGVVYVSTRNNNEKGEIFALNAYTGEVIWRSGNIGNFTSTPAVNQNFLFIGTEEGSMICLNRTDGRLKWKYPGRGKLMASPALSGEVVIFGTGDGFLTSLNQTTGEEISKIGLGGEIITSPIISNHKIIVTFSNTCVAIADNIDFSITTNPKSLTLYQAEETSLDIAIESSSSLSQNIFLKMDGVPVGLEAILSPNIVKLTNQKAKAILKLSATKEMKPGTYRFGIIAETSGRQRRAEVMVEVLKISEGKFTLELSPQNGEVFAGNAIVFQVNVNTTEGYSGVVNLSVLNMPAGFQFKFNENRLEVPGMTNLVVLVDITVDPDRYSFAIQGKGGGRTELTRASINVKGTKRYDWNGFGNGSRLTNFTKESVSENIELRYTVQADGAIRSQPAIVGDYAYFTTEKVTPSKTHSSKLYAIDLRTGEAKWDYFLGTSAKILPEIGTETKDDPPPWVSSPRVEGDKLLVGTLDGILFCFNRFTGKPVWYKNVGSSIRGTPCVGEGRVFFGTENNKIYGLDLESGEQRWVTDVKGPIYSSPSYYKSRVLVSSYDNSVYSLSPANGLVFYSFNGFRSSFKASPISGEDSFYIGGAGENRFFYRVNYTGLQKWQILTPEEIPATAAIDEDEKNVYYIGITDKSNMTLAELSKINVETKEKVWGFSAGGGVVTSSPIVAGDKIIFGGTDKNLNVVGTDGRLIFKYLLDDKIQSSPAVGRGVLLIGTNSGKLYCFSSSMGFTLIPDRQEVTVFQGESVDINVGVLSDMPLKQPVKFALENVPSGTTFEFTPAELSKFPGTVTLKVRTTDRTQAGKYKLTIVGSSGSFRRLTTFELRVQNMAPGKFALRSEQLEKEVNAGTSINANVYLDVTGGFNAPVTFSVANKLPEDVTLIFNPKIVSPPGKTNVTFRIGPSVAPQTFTVTIKGEGGGKTAELTFTFTVFESLKGDFTLKVSPLKAKMYAGESFSFEITADSFDGFNESIQLSTSLSQPDLSYTLQPETIIPGEKAILSVQSASTALPSTIRFDLKGKAFKTEKKIPLELEIAVELGDFNLNITPNLLLTGTAGTTISYTFTPTSSVNWNAPLAFKTQNLPTSISVEFQPTSIEPSDMGKVVKVNFTINPNADTELLSFSIQGVGGGKIRTYSIKFQILSIKGGLASLSFEPLLPQIKKEKETQINILIQGSKDLIYIDFYFVWDPAYVTLTEIKAGNFFSTNEKEITLIQEVEAGKGRMKVKIFKNDQKGVSGDGVLVTLKLVGVTKGTTTISIEEPSAKTATLDPFPIQGNSAKTVVTQFLAGDVNGDGTVNIDDLAIFSRAFGSKKGDQNFDARCDFNNDGAVDGVDLILLAYNWGEYI